MLHFFFLWKKKSFINNPKYPRKIVGTMTSTRNDREESRWNKKKVF